MNISQLEAFVLLAETEHMTQTAKKLKTSQPNLSYTISELEKELGVPLFKKSGRNIKLTKYGHIFYEHASSALTKLKQATTIIQEEVNPNSGTINFGFIYTIGSEIAPMLTRTFLEKEENKNIKFSFSQGNSFQLLQKLNDEDIDIAITSFVKDADNVNFEKLLQQNIYLVVPKNHPLAEKDGVYLKETANYPYVYFDKNSGLRPYLDNLMRTLDFSPNITIEANEDHTLLGFVSQNHGITIMPKIRSLNSYPVKVLEILDKHEPRWLYLATRSDGFTTPTVLRFKNFCTDYFNK
ncbi:LysR family transcriptional regulator [Gemella cuniculi]|uniref:LysR family transcriptional regulator n=1 Tax=Gemella cuniculi TaxID=150240 RepID=UPI00041BA310|nr:LysR family transcriptional regulator [Gemella cuniculi]